MNFFKGFIIKYVNVVYFCFCSGRYLILEKLWNLFINLIKCELEFKFKLFDFKFCVFFIYNIVLFKYLKLEIKM